MAKGHPKAPGATRPFASGNDSRRNLNGRPPVDVLVTQIKGEVKEHLIRSLKEFYMMDVAQVMRLANDNTKAMGERIAMRFLVEMANKGDPARLSLLARIVGIDMAPDVQINTQVNLSLEDLVTASHVDDDERIVEAANGSKVIVRKKKDE